MLELPTDCITKVVAYQHHIINFHQKHDHHLGQVGNDEIPVLFDMLINSAIHTEGEKSVLAYTTEHGRLRVTVMLSVLAEGRGLTPFAILRSKDLLKEKLRVDLCLSEMVKGG
jgi:hypothetical protein